MIVKIGHAESDEEKRSSGGRAGDQTGREVYVRDWYNRSKGWTNVFRAVKKKDREAIAVAMEQACENDRIGYDQGQRTTLYDAAKKAKWDISKITTACETDCSALVAVCVNAAGISVSKDMYTGNEAKALRATKMFREYATKNYLTKPDKLQRGDILLGPGHTAIVVSVIERFYPKYTGASGSIVDALSSLGIDPSFSHRVEIARINNIADYAGSGMQNLAMLSLLKEGKLIKAE